MSLAYIIDEEEQHALFLKSTLDIMDCFDQVEIFTRSETAYKTMPAKKPAIVFANFDIPLIKGAALYSEMVRLQVPFVCITENPDTCLTAVSLQAFDYLVKPLQLSRLEEIIRKYLQHTEFLSKETTPAPLLFHEILIRQKDKIMVNTSECISIIPIESIIKIEGLNNYSRIYTDDGNMLMTSKTLKYFESQLSSYAFVRIHKSHLVNLVFIDKLLNRGGSQILLKTGEILETTREKRTEIKEWFKM